MCYSNKIVSNLFLSSTLYTSSNQVFNHIRHFSHTFIGDDFKSINPMFINRVTDLNKIL